MKEQQTQLSQARDIEKLADALKEILNIDQNEFRREYGKCAPAFALGVCKGIASVALRETGNAD